MCFKDWIIFYFGWETFQKPFFLGNDKRKNDDDFNYSKEPSLNCGKFQSAYFLTIFNLHGFKL